ncbi:MAG: ATP-dependent zinc metalloprotease FtsH [Oscillospiraceae bacterium]|nr:ATP-dependent zinc metalloprotease FtsH [Oscillospiraceae bacterium]
MENNNNNNNRNRGNNRRIRDIGFYALILVVLLATVYSLTGTSTTVTVTYSEVIDLFDNQQVESFVVSGDDLYLYLREPYEGVTEIVKTLRDVNQFNEDLGDTIKEQKAAGILTEYDYDEGWTAPWWLSFIPYLIVIVVFGVLWYAMMSRADGGAGGVARFSKAHTRVASEDQKKKTFADVAGCDEEKEELQEIVEFLKNPGAYTAMGARIPKGVLLVGPPGTGKTLMAKAVAGEAGVQFLSISGSDFVELYVGVGASRVRDLFEQAKKVAPAIIFIDEIDAVGRQRGSGLGGGHDEREQTLNQLLVEMDGFTNNEGVIVMAATNRADILDNALLRPGRFDRQVYIGLPDVKGREEILKVHAKDKPLGDDVDLNSIARGTPGFSGADLENLLNEAALLAVRRHRRFVVNADIDDAILKVAMGPEKKSRVISEKERRLTAYHESGHAIAAKYLEHVDPVHYITIIPRGQAGGFTLMRPTEDKTFQARSDMFEDIVMSLGGRMAEKLFLDDISTGASGDIQQASKLARSMVMQYGMSERLGPISYDDSGHSLFIGRDFGTTKSYSEETAAIIDEEVKRIFDEASAKCEEILNAHREQLIAVAEYLLVHESMDGADFDYFCDHGELPPKQETAPASQEPEPEPQAVPESAEQEAPQETPDQEPEARPEPPFPFGGEGL